jgi:hypothetical protein
MKNSNTQEKSNTSKQFDKYNEKYTTYCFYEGQYKKRAFIKDHYSDLGKFQEKYDMLYNHVLDASSYYLVCSFFRGGLFDSSFVDECDYFVPGINEYKIIISRIEQLQLYYLYKNDDKFEYICKNMIDSVEFCKFFFEKYDGSKIETVNSISSKYGLFITDLMSSIDEINIEDIEYIHKKYKPYKPYPDDTMMGSYLKNTYLNIESKIQSKRFYDAISKLASGDNEQMSDIEKYNLNKYMKVSTSIKEFRCSEKARNLGLFMWDNYYSPMNKKKKLVQIFSELELKYGEITQVIEGGSYVRAMNRILKNTVDCINAHHVIPIKAR